MFISMLQNLHHKVLEAIKNKSSNRFIGSIIIDRIIMACRIYIGNLPLDIRESEIDDLFYK
jgi:RNA recognition motif-containing protein